MNKKGVAIGVTTIVVVVIALLVLIVVIAAFSGQFQGFGKAIRDCNSKGGQCKEVCTSDESQYFGVGICKVEKGDDKDKCCISLVNDNKLANGRTCTRNSECDSNKCTGKVCVTK